MKQKILYNSTAGECKIQIPHKQSIDIISMKITLIQFLDIKFYNKKKFNLKSTLYSYAWITLIDKKETNRQTNYRVNR